MNNRSEKVTDMRLFRLAVDDNFVVTVINYGARVVSVETRDKNGVMTNVAVGFDAPEKFMINENYYGAVIGRYANRIAGAQFYIDNVLFKLPVNDNNINSLHGGPQGFHTKYWEVIHSDQSSVELTHTSMDGESGFPGKLETSVLYNVEANGRLRITYKAVTDKKTIVNFTNHTFFNLNGKGSGSIEQHDLTIHASQYLPLGENGIPVSVPQPVADTAFDFQIKKAISPAINENNVQLLKGRGFDHCFILQKNVAEEIILAAVAQGEQSGIVMKVFTTEPAIQLYTGNFMEGENELGDGIKDDFRTAFCLETQHYPNGPNEPSFPPVILQPGETFASSTIYQFSLSDQ